MRLITYGILYTLHDDLSNYHRIEEQLDYSQLRDYVTALCCT